MKKRTREEDIEKSILKNMYDKLQDFYNRASDEMIDKNKIPRSKNLQK